MPLDGLRAWIGEVERKLGMRTRVFLVLATLAIGGAGAAIYLAVDTRDSAVSEGDVQELQERLEAQSGGGAAVGADPRVGQLETELKALEAKVEQLEGGGNGTGQSGTGTGTGQGGGGTDGGASSGAGGASGGASSAAGAGLDGDTPGEAKLRDLLEEAKEQNEKAEEAE